MNITEEISTSSLICQLALHIKADLNNAFQAGGFNITSEQWGVLKCLWREDGITPSDIAEKTKKDKASITRILDIMQRNNLIRRCDDALDRRSYRIFLTAAGKKLESKLKALVHITNQRLYQNLDDGELKELQRLLIKLKDDQN